MSNEYQAFDRKALNERLDIDFALKAVGIGVWELDPTTHLVSWDERCCELHGVAETNPIPYDQVLRRIHPGDMVRVQDTLQRVMDLQTTESFEVTYRTLGESDGSTVCWVRFTGRSYVNEAGQVYRLAGVMQDVSLQVQQQEELTASRQLNQLATEATGVGAFRLRLADGYIKYDPLVAKILTGREGIQFDRDMLASFIHPDDRLIRQQAYADGLRTGKLQFTVRFFWYDGSLHWIHILGAYLFDESGQPEGIIGIVQDITEQVLNQQQLQTTAQRFRHVVEQAPTAIALFSGQDMRIEVCNDTMFTVLGKDRSVIGWPLLTVVPEIDGQEFVKLLEDVYATGQTYVDNEVPVSIQRNGVAEDAYFDFSFTPLRDETGTVSGVMALGTDVTIQLATAHAIKESEARLRSLIQAAPVAIAIFMGRELVIEEPNQTFIDIVGKG